MAKLTSLQVDLDRLSEATHYDWEDDTFLDGPHESHLWFLLMPWNNPAFRRRAITELNRGVRVRAGGVDEDEGERGMQRMVHAMAHDIVKGWGNMEGDDGEPIVYTPKTCEKLLSDPRNYLLRDGLMEAAREMERRALRRREVAEGN